MSNSSFESFKRSVAERYQEFRQAFNELISVLSSENRDAKVKAAKKTEVAIQHLVAILSTSDRPEWASRLEHPLRSYVAHPDTQKNAESLMRHVIGYSGTALNHTWDFSIPTQYAIDFESIFAEAFAVSEVPALFNELLRHLEAIVDSGEVDSMTAIRSLETLIQTIQRNRNGTYFETAGTVGFVRTFMKNYVFELLKTIPGVKPLVAAATKTADQLDVDMAKVSKQVSIKLASLAHGEVKAISYQGNTPAALPPPASDSLPKG